MARAEEPKANMETNGDEFLNKKELAARLKVSLRTVEQWQHDGHIPYLRVAGVLLFHWPAVVKALTEKFTIRRGGSATPVRADEELKTESAKTEIGAEGKAQGGKR